MSKKSRRSRSKHQASITKTPQGMHLKQSGPVTSEVVAAKPKVPINIGHKSQHLVVDYRYVGRDVKYIGILAGSLFVILIVLSVVFG